MDDHITPEMDRDRIKRMGHSLIAFSRLRSLLKMSRQQLADMPKEVMIACAPNEIALVWDRLPVHLQNDVDILKYQYCTEHYNYTEDGSSSIDVNDGPSPRRIFCCYCNVHDVNLATDNNINTSLSTTQSTGSKRRKISHICCSQ